MRKLIGLLIVSMTVLTATPAGANPPPGTPGPPIGGCPPVFQGPLTFEQISDMWPPPPDLPDPEGVLAAFDLNDDRLLCVMESPHGLTPVGPINIIDNVAST
jgi:hypothetical protein